MGGWAYQDRRSSKYDADLPQDFYTYNGPEDLLKWFNWLLKAPNPNYLDGPDHERLIVASRALDEGLFDRFGLVFPDSEVYDRTIGTANAQDFQFPQVYPGPERQRIGSMVDFGAGYGRQANLWVQRRPDLTYVSVDGIPLSYCLQHFYYSNLPSELRDYVVEPGEFSVRLNDPGIYHLPTWRLDLLPSNSFDLVTCVQVLPELSRTMLDYALHNFHRVLKPGGALYIRDHDRQWRPGHGRNTNRVLSRLGFELEFHPQVIDRVEIWGVPRVWRKYHPDVSGSRKRSFGGLLRDWRSVADSWTGGRLRRMAVAVRERTKSG
ncbi:MAG TPA: class I SAM-dependent methyltransferase, partial [Rhodothermia bacterium]|nr:class I SAM-dependent methyltransferase [Rhodothermia bacterium]